MAVIFVMTVASMFSWIIYNYILVPYNVTYLYTIVFILVIASLVQLVEMVLQKFSPALYEALGIFRNVIKPHERDVDELENRQTRICVAPPPAQVCPDPMGKNFGK